MATTKTNIDGLGVYHTGAHVDGGTQHDEQLCLGGARSGTELRRLAAYIKDPIPQVVVDWLSGQNTTGDGTITASSTSDLKWTSPGSTQGSAVTVADGGTVLLEDGDDDKGVRITRDGSVGLTGEMTLTIAKALNNVLGMDNVTNAERVAGSDTYRGLMIRNHGLSEITGVVIRVGTFGTQRTSDDTQLPGAGAGTIVTTGSFADWPAAGWVRIETNVGALREIAYYTSRTVTTLTIPAAGRGLLGTAAAGGANDDTVDAVPGIRIALETVASDGTISTIANESTEPVGPPMWDARLISFTPLTVNANKGLWIHREIPAGATVDVAVESKINLQWVYGGTTYNETISGLYRIEDSTIPRYELYVGIDADPDLTGAATTSSTGLPFSYLLPASSSGTIEYRYTVLDRNDYDLASLNQYWRKTVLDTGGTAQTATPTAPINVSVIDGDGGEMVVEADYSPNNDSTAAAADTWAVYISGDDDDPSTSGDTAETETMVEPPFFGTPSFRLRRETGPFPKGSEVRFLVRAQRSTDGIESENTDATTETVGTIGPSAGTLRQTFFGESRHQYSTAPTIGTTYVIDTTANVRWVVSQGQTDFMVGSALWLRLKLDNIGTAGADNNGWWTTLGYKQEVISGATTGDVVHGVEMASTSLFYIPSNGVRRMKLDLSTGNEQISYTALREASTGNESTVHAYSTEPCAVFDFHTLFQVWDREGWDFDTVTSLRFDGVSVSDIPWRQRQTTGDFE